MRINRSLPLKSLPSPCHVHMACYFYHVTHCDAFLSVDILTDWQAGLESATISCSSPVPPTPLSIYIQPNFTPGLFSLTTPFCHLLPVFSYLVYVFLPHTPTISDGWAVGMVDTFIIRICAFISKFLHAVWRALVSEPAALAVPREERGLYFRKFMEDLSPRQLAVKQLKQQFLRALQTNNFQDVLQILHSGKLDIDTVLEVEDPSMVLASYKQGEEEVG